jgi:Tfp pilus assembly pilus retraction ATPase PilT
MLALSIDDLVREMKELDASDLHLTAESKPVVRRRGKLETLEQHEVLTPEDTRDLLYRILSTEQQKVLETRRHIDMAYSIPGVGRLRVNVFFQRAALGAAFRRSARCPSSGCPSTSRRSPTSRAGSCSSPGRPAQASRRRWPR